MNDDFTKYDVMMMSDKMEDLRKIISKRRKFVAVLIIIFFISTIFPPLSFIIIIFSVIFGMYCLKDEKEFKRIFKTEFVPRVLNECFDNVYYGANEGFTQEHIKVMKIMWTGNRYRTEDFISADYKGVHFQRADVYSAHHTGGKNSHTTVYFKGRVYQVMFNKTLSTAVQIRSKNYHYCDTPQYLNRKRDLVTMENQEFNKEFEVYAGSQQDAFYVLTPHLMESLLKLRKCFTSMCIMIVGNRLILAGNSSLDGLEAQIKQPIVFEHEKARIREELSEITDIIDTLNLSNRNFMY